MPQELKLKVWEVARAVGKSEGYVRQHIHRGHLKASKEGRRRLIDVEEARRWAKEYGLESETGMSGVTHAIIMPFPVSNLVTWCGHRCDSRAVKNDFIADSPERVTCQRCIEVMREAHKNLKAWVPKLKAEGQVEPPLPSPPDGILERKP